MWLDHNIFLAFWAWIRGLWPAQNNDFYSLYFFFLSIYKIQILTIILRYSSLVSSNQRRLSLISNTSIRNLIWLDLRRWFVGWDPLRGRIELWSNNREPNSIKSSVDSPSPLGVYLLVLWRLSQWGVQELCGYNMDKNCHTLTC